MWDWIDKFRQNGLLKDIYEEVDIDLEIAHLSYLEVKKDDSKILLFHNPVDKNGKKYQPVLTNTFSSFKALKLIFGRDLNQIIDEIETLLKPKKPKNFTQKLEFVSMLLSMRKIFPKRVKLAAKCQEIVKLGKDINLYDLPILKTWPKDAGAFITMGQVYTKSLDGEVQNLGMYRLQVKGEKKLAMHWQIHKDGANFFNEYKKAGIKMPVSIAIGGDPLYIWCSQAPLPKGVFELLLYGFIRKTPAKIVKSITNSIYIPHDVDYVIEGFVDTNRLEDEGPFGDHTGFYTPIGKFPVLEVSAITSTKNPVFQATVVGKPPLEDKFMGYATERIFLPLFKTTAPDLIDYKMPENGVFHNLIFAKINSTYPAHAQQMMHAFWGVGQMSFVKHAVFVDKSAPALDDYHKFSKYVLDRITPKSLLFSHGICDELDHASPNSCFGGKLGVDATVDLKPKNVTTLQDKELLLKFRDECQDIVDVKQYFLDTKNPIAVISIRKNGLIKNIFKSLLIHRQFFKIIVFFDDNVNLANDYMLVWRCVNNIDALRDIFIDDNQIAIDATSKSSIDGYLRQWPLETLCDENIIKKLIDKKLIDYNIDFFRYYEIY